MQAPLDNPQAEHRQEMLCQSDSNRIDEIVAGFFDEVPDMLAAFVGHAKRSHLLICTTEDGV